MYGEERQKRNDAQIELNNKTIREACKKIAEELNDCKVEVSKHEYGSNLYATVTRGTAEVRLAFRARAKKGSYHYEITDQLDVEVGERYSQGNFYKRFPPRKAGIPVGPIVQEVTRQLVDKPKFEERQGQAEKAREQLEDDIEAVHDRLRVPFFDKKHSIRSGPHLGVASAGNRLVKLEGVFGMPLEDAEKVLKLVMELEAARK